MNWYSLIGAKNSILGEGPLWCKDKNCLYYMDIDGKKLNCIDWKSKEFTVYNLPQKAGCIALTEENDLVYAMEDGIYNSDFKLLHNSINISGRRFNDGKVAPDGLFYAGTISDGRQGKLYKLNNQTLETVLDNIKISNGIDWSTDEKTMYYCDTSTHRIVAFDFPSMNNKRTVIVIPKTMGNPDGLCVDSEDNIWIALWGGGAVIRISPKNASILEKIKLPVSKVSCPCFAGENLDELAVTSASVDIDLNEEPLAGCTFLIKINAKGKLPYKLGGKHE